MKGDETNARNLIRVVYAKGSHPSPPMSRSWAASYAKWNFLKCIAEAGKGSPSTKRTYRYISSSIRQ